MRKAYSYLRFSTKEQALGDSERRQVKNAERYAKENGLNLDTSLRDLGISAHHGLNVNKNLGRFIELAQSGQLGRDGVLIVESVDRISRQEPYETIKLLQKLWDSGVTIVTLIPQFEISRESLKKEPHVWHVLLGVMQRAYEESLIKSERSSSAWEAKRENIHEKIATKICPNWMRYDEDQKKFVLIPDRTKALKMIIDLACEGIGAHHLTRRLNREKVGTWGKRKIWDIQTIKHLLNSKALIGEYQPKKNVVGKQPQPFGDPIKGYYPAAISEPVFYKLQAALMARKFTTKGRTGRLNNLFGPILTSGVDDSIMRLTTAHYGKIGMQSDSSRNGQMEKMPTNFIKNFLYEPFEKAFIRWVREVKMLGMVQEPDSGIEELEGRLLTVGAKITKIEAAMEQDDDGLDRLIAKLKEFAKQEKELIKELEKAKAKEQKPLASIHEINQIVGQLESVTGEELILLRQRLRAAIARAVEKVKVYFTKIGQRTCCLAEVLLKDGTVRIFAMLRERGKIALKVDRKKGASPKDVMTEASFNKIHKAVPKPAMMKLAVALAGCTNLHQMFDAYLRVFRDQGTKAA
jgi:DNA invertase Pin-like site-specific DNA recombinase